MQCSFFYEQCTAYTHHGNNGCTCRPGYFLRRSVTCMQLQWDSGTKFSSYTLLVATSMQLEVLVINQLQRFVCNIYRNTNPEGWVLLYSIQSEGLVDNYFPAHCFYRYSKHMFLALKNCMNVCPGPQDPYNSKHNMDMNPTRRVCITYTVPCIP